MNDKILIFLFQFIESYSDIVLHPHHYLIMIATRNLIQYYTYSNEALPTQTLRHKHQLCRNFANVLAKIDPGFSEIKTFILKVSVYFLRFWPLSF